MERRTAVLAVRPNLAVALLHGSKQFEFRRIKPALRHGDLIYVYSTAPVQAILGGFSCGDILEGKPETLWRKLRRNAGTPRAVFREYFADSERACAIEVIEPFAWLTPLTLTAIRCHLPSFHPPQSYKFLVSGDPLTRLIDGFAANGGSSRGAAGRNSG